MPIHFCGDITIDNYEFYGDFDREALAKVVKGEDDPTAAAPNPTAVVSATDKNAADNPTTAAPTTVASAADKNAADNASGTEKNSEGESPKKIIVRQLGGSYLLARFTAVAWSVWHNQDKDGNTTMEKLEPWAAFRKQLNEQLNSLFESPREFDRNWQVSYRLMKCKDEYRVPRGGNEGFTPPIGPAETLGTAPRKDPVLDVGKSRLFVVNDRSPGNRPDQSPIELKPNKDDWIVVKFIDPAANPANVSHLADLLRRHPNNVVGICSGDDLRKSTVPISRGLSWERTIRDVINGIQSNNLLSDKLPPHLVITFNYDAALYLKIRPGRGRGKPKVEEGSLVFSIDGAEGDFASNIEGDMPGAQTAFVSAFSALLYEALEDGLPEANQQRGGESTAKSHNVWPDSKPHQIEKHIDYILTFALIAKRRLLKSGFSIGDTNLPFALEERKPQARLRHMPVVYYSEGIFSVRKRKPKPKPSEQKSHSFDEPPAPQIPSDGSIKKRHFDNPLSLDSDSFSNNLEEHGLACYRIRPENVKPENVKPENVQGDWSIFEEAMSAEPTKAFAQFANYVIKGEAPPKVPIASFGKIKTADMEEIEDFRTVRTLLRSYLSNLTATKPIGIAVFGPPGAGKGFSVKNITEALPDSLKELVKDRHECNLTALSDPEDLAHYFQLARNSVLRGKVPLLFFDEFDCSVEQTKYYWLKHFLAPLQDGEFRHDRIVHPIGRAIFIFAGGVHPKFKEFAEAMEANRMAVKRKAETDKEFANAMEAKRKAGKRNTKAGKAHTISAASAEEDPQNFKGVDFLSRLHGHIDVKPFSPDGDAKAAVSPFHPNRDDPHAILVDPCFLMRRAITLRSMLEMHQERIFTQSSKKAARVNRAVVNALLATKTYYHGARSMEAIVRMSYLEGGDSLEIAHLPPDNQLAMHVDSVNFRYCLDSNLDEVWKAAAET
jgi:hypothetical protein